MMMGRIPYFTCWTASPTGPCSGSNCVLTLLNLLLLPKHVSWRRVCHILVLQSTLMDVNVWSSITCLSLKKHSLALFGVYGYHIHLLHNSPNLSTCCWSFSITMVAQCYKTDWGKSLPVESSPADSLFGSNFWLDLYNTPCRKTSTLLRIHMC